MTKFFIRLPSGKLKKASSKEQDQYVRECEERGISQVIARDCSGDLTIKCEFVGVVMGDGESRMFEVYVDWYGKYHHRVYAPTADAAMIAYNDLWSCSIGRMRAAIKRTREIVDKINEGKWPGFESNRKEPA